MEIKETMELLEGVKVVAVTGAKVFADGKVNLADLGKLQDLIVNFSTLKEAVLGVDDVDDELKDLDTTEITQLASKAMEIVKAVKEASNGNAA